MARQMTRTAPRGLVLVAALLTFSQTVTRRTRDFTPRKVRLRFVHSPYADYLFYLLYRNTNEFTSISTIVPLDRSPLRGNWSRYQKLLRHLRSENYQDIYPLLGDYRNATGRVILKPKPKTLGYSEPLPSYENLI